MGIIIDMTVNPTGDDKDHDTPPEMPIIDKSNVMQISMGPSTSTASLCKYLE